MVEQIGETERQDSSDSSRNQFGCRICFDPVQHPVVNFCGHMFWYVQFYILLYLKRRTIRWFLNYLIIHVVYIKKHLRSFKVV